MTQVFPVSYCTENRTYSFMQVSVYWLYLPMKQIIFKNIIKVGLAPPGNCPAQRSSVFSLGSLHTCLPPTSPPAPAPSWPTGYTGPGVKAPGSGLPLAQCHTGRPVSSQGKIPVGLGGHAHSACLGSGPPTCPQTCRKEGLSTGSTLVC